MPWGAAAAIVGGVVGAVGSKKAAGKKVKGINAAVGQQENTLANTLGLLQPGREVGNQALNTFASAFIPGFEGIAGLDPISAEQLSEQFRNLPGTQFQINEAERAVGNSFASRGGAFSGNAVRALGDRTAGFAADRTFAGLERLLGLGERSTFGAVGAESSAGANISNLFVKKGLAKSQGVQAGTEAIQGGLNNLLFSAGGGFGK